MNRTQIHWRENSGFPSHIAMIEAVPGVGNVGKLVIDGLKEKYSSTCLGWLIHPDFPPHASLGSDGLLSPPGMEIYSVVLDSGDKIITISGNMQPITAAGQFEVSEAILKLAVEEEVQQLLVLAGLSAEVEDRDIHVICSQSKVREKLESNDIIVSKQKPDGGMIGISGMVLSLSKIHEVPAIGVVADTIGTSADFLAAERLSKWIEDSFSIPLNLDLDTTEKTAKKLLQSMNPEFIISDYFGDDNEVAGDFYV